ncbi:MAG: hypothetical protein IPN86_24650 [Saprospiraceae bacterium]|nr:hypothetical protein [Saprospiraceae bacterium]
MCRHYDAELDGFGVLWILSNHPSTMDNTIYLPFIQNSKEDFRRGKGLGADGYGCKTL